LRFLRAATSLIDDVMVEVFKTNIRCHAHALAIGNFLRDSFGGYIVNFDLDDCDHIMRIRSLHGSIDSERVCRIVLALGFEANVLADETEIVSQD
jgi:hypothetical protein